MTVTNGTYSGDSRVLPGGTATVTIAANEGYELPDTITVTGATGAWNKTNGTLSISNPKGNVTVAAKCVVPGRKLTFYGNGTCKINGETVSQGPWHPLNNGDVITIYNDGEVNATSINSIDYYTFDANIELTDTDIIAYTHSIGDVPPAIPFTVTVTFYE